MLAQSPHSRTSITYINEGRGNLPRPSFRTRHSALLSHLGELLEESVVLLEALLGGLEHRLRLLHFGPTFFTSCLKRVWGWVGGGKRRVDRRLIEPLKRGEMRRAKRGKPRRRRARRARSGRARPRQFSELSSAALSRPTPRHRRPSQHHQRGQPPASPRRGNVPMEGATPAGGGKPSAADSGQTRLAPNRRARFWAA